MTPTDKCISKERGRVNVFQAQFDAKYLTRASHASRESVGMQPTRSRSAARAKFSIPHSRDTPNCAWDSEVHVPHLIFFEQSDIEGLCLPPREIKNRSVPNVEGGQRAEAERAKRRRQTALSSEQLQDPTRPRTLCHPPNVAEVGPKGLGKPRRPRHDRLGDPLDLSRPRKASRSQRALTARAAPRAVGIAPGRPPRFGRPRHGRPGSPLVPGRHGRREKRRRSGNRDGVAQASATSFGHPGRCRKRRGAPHTTRLGSGEPGCAGRPRLHRHGSSTVPVKPGGAAAGRPGARTRSQTSERGPRHPSTIGRAGARVRHAPLTLYTSTTTAHKTTELIRRRSTTDAQERGRSCPAFVNCTTSYHAIPDVHVATITVRNTPTSPADVHQLNPGLFDVAVLFSTAPPPLRNSAAARRVRPVRRQRRDPLGAQKRAQQGVVRSLERDPLPPGRSDLPSLSSWPKPMPLPQPEPEDAAAQLSPGPRKPRSAPKGPPIPTTHGSSSSFAGTRTKQPSSSLHMVEHSTPRSLHSHA